MQKRAAEAKGLTFEEYLENHYKQKRNRAPQPKPRRPRLWISMCVECREPFTTPRSGAGICGDECRRVRKNRQTSKSIMKRYYSDPEFRDTVIGRAHARRAEALGVGSLHVTIGYLLERDGWICGVCNEFITSRNDASLDHIVPLSRGGTHDLGNVQVTHRFCNYSKGNKTQDELSFSGSAAA